MSVKSVVTLAALALVAVAAITVVGGSWYTIDQGESGVVLRNGAVVGEAQPGLNFKLPIFESVVRVSTREQVARWTCNGIVDCAETDFSVMQAYSKDQQPADLRVSVNYSCPPGDASKLYSEFGSIDAFVARSLARKAPQAVKEVFGQYNAATAVADRAGLSNKALVTLQTMTADEPCIITALQVENIDYSDAYENAVEERMLAEVDVAKRNQQLEQEKILANIAVTQAQGRADSVRAEADANAYAVEVAGKAEAASIAARGQALASNPALVDLTAVQSWDGKLPTSIPPNGTVPFINLNQ